jgi:hypothetical protein
MFGAPPAAPANPSSFSFGAPNQNNKQPFATPANPAFGAPQSQPQQGGGLFGSVSVIAILRGIPLTSRLRPRPLVDSSVEPVPPSHKLILVGCLGIQAQISLLKEEVHYSGIPTNSKTNHKLPSLARRISNNNNSLIRYLAAHLTLNNSPICSRSLVRNRNLRSSHNSKCQIRSLAPLAGRRMCLGIVWREGVNGLKWI